MSPRHVFPSRVLLPLSQQVSMVVQEVFCRWRMRWLLEGFGMGVVHTPAPSCALADLLFSLGMSPRHVFPSRVLFPLSQRVSLVGQMAFFDNACEGRVRV